MTNKQEPEIRTLADKLDAENKLARENETLKNEFEWIPPHKRM